MNNSEWVILPRFGGNLNQSVINKVNEFMELYIENISNKLSDTENWTMDRKVLDGMLIKYNTTPIEGEIILRYSSFIEVTLNIEKILRPIIREKKLNKLFNE